MIEQTSDILFPNDYLKYVHLPIFKNPEFNQGIFIPTKRVFSALENVLDIYVGFSKLHSRDTENNLENYLIQFLR